MKQKLIWNLSLCYFSLFCFYLSGYDARTAERKSDSIGARDTNKLRGCIIPADQSAG